MAGLDTGLLNACHELWGGELGVKAPARWSGHERNTDSLSLESSATPHAALGKGGRAGGEAPCPLLKAPLFGQTPHMNARQQEVVGPQQEAGKGMAAPAPAGGGGKSRQFDIHRPYNGRGSVAVAALCPPSGSPILGRLHLGGGWLLCLPPNPSRNRGDDPSKPPGPGPRPFPRQPRPKWLQVLWLNGSKGSRCGPPSLGSPPWHPRAPSLLGWSGHPTCPP